MGTEQKMKKLGQLIFLLVIVAIILEVKLAYNSRVLAEQPLDTPQPLRVAMILSPAGPAVTEAKLQQARHVVNRRLENLYLAGTYSIDRQGEQLVVKLNRSDNIPYTASVISSVGQIEFIDGGANPPLGHYIEEERPLFTDQEIETVIPPAGGHIFYQLILKSQAVDRVDSFVETQPGAYLCMVLDAQVISCSTMYHWEGRTLEILPGLEESSLIDFSDLAVFLDSGPLPIPLRVSTY